MQERTKKEVGLFHLIRYVSGQTVIQIFERGNISILLWANRASTYEEDSFGVSSKVFAKKSGGCKLVLLLELNESAVHRVCRLRMEISQADVTVHSTF